MVKAGVIKFERKWKNKTTGKIFNVVPWWSCDGSLVDRPEELLKDDTDDWKDRLFCIGVLGQIGWMIENDNGVWFGVGPKAKEQFEEIEETNKEIEHENI